MERNLHPLSGLQPTRVWWSVQQLVQTKFIIWYRPIYCDWFYLCICIIQFYLVIVIFIFYELYINQFPCSVGWCRNLQQGSDHGRRLCGEPEAWQSQLLHIPRRGHVTSEPLQHLQVWRAGGPPPGHLQGPRGVCDFTSCPVSICYQNTLVL